MATYYDLMDIEELVELGKENAFCPFYFQRNKKSQADIIFMPYNYLFELKIRESLGLEIENCIVLIDEAHNIESVCQDAKSYQFSTALIDECLNDLKNIRISMENDNLHLKDEKLSHKDTIKNLSINENILNSIKQYLKSFDIKSTPQGNVIKKLSPKELFNIFFEGSTRKDMQQKLLIDIKATADPNTIITPENIQNHAMFLRRIQKMIEDDLGKFTILDEYASLLEVVDVLYKDFTKNMEKDNYITNYKLFLDDVEENKNQRDKKVTRSRTLFLHCMNPGFGYLDIKDYKPITCIITSGTLHPLESTESELKTQFPIKLENKHVIDPCQVNFAILTASVRKRIPFRFDQNSKNNKDMQAELGYTILDLTKITPGGILVFFASYAYLNTCTNEWCEQGIMSELEKYKEVFKDMSESNKNKLIVKGFKESSEKKGGILFSVVRGSSSEGIDFADDLARLVIVVGVPYPNLGDTKVTLKKEFLDETLRNSLRTPGSSNNGVRKLTSGDWYTQCATKAVNQALGRVIRHVDDYGSMILIDNRYSELLRKQCFSKWLRERARVYDDIKVIVDTKSFFENMPGFIKEKRLKRINESKNGGEDTNTDIARKRVNTTEDDDESSSGSFTKVFNMKKSLGKTTNDEDRFFKSTVITDIEKKSPKNNRAKEVNNILPVSSNNIVSSALGFTKKTNYNENTIPNTTKQPEIKPTNKPLDDSCDFLIDDSLFKIIEDMNNEDKNQGTGIKERPNVVNNPPVQDNTAIATQKTNNINVVINVNTTNNIQLATPKQENQRPPEFDTETFMRKLMHFKESNELENILEKYGIKVKVDSQADVPTNEPVETGDPNKKVLGRPCPICYEHKE
jgi:DNA repair helicase Rad3